MSESNDAGLEEYLVRGGRGGEGTGGRGREGGLREKRPRESIRGGGLEGRVEQEKKGRARGSVAGEVLSLPFDPDRRRRGGVRSGGARRGSGSGSAPFCPLLREFLFFEAVEQEKDGYQKSELFFCSLVPLSKTPLPNPEQKRGGGGEGKKRKISETLQLTAAGVPSAGTGSGPGTGAPPGSGNTDAAGAMLAMHSSISPAGTCSCSSDSLKCWATVQKCPRWTPRSRMRRSWASAIDLPRYWPGPPKA